MSGAVSCPWQPWFQANYKFEKIDDFNDPEWAMRHARGIMDMRDTLRPTVDSVRTTAQSSFWWERPNSNLRIAGEPDLVTISGDEACVYDVKTGKPRQSDRLQVMIYMYCLPDALPHIFAGMRMSGCVVYKESQLVEIPTASVGEEFREMFDFFLDKLDTDEEPEPIPSAQECRFCKISKVDCPSRVEGDGLPSVLSLYDDDL